MTNIQNYYYACCMKYDGTVERIRFNNREAARAYISDIQSDDSKCSQYKQLWTE